MPDRSHSIFVVTSINLEATFASMSKPSREYYTANPSSVRDFVMYNLQGVSLLFEFGVDINP